MKISKSYSPANWMDQFIKKQSQVIPDDGYADGGEPYTDEEMDLMDPVGQIVEVVNEKSEFFGDAGGIAAVKEENGMTSYLVNLYRGGQVWINSDDVAPAYYNFGGRQK